MSFRASARYVPVKQFEKVQKIYLDGGKKEDIDGECQKWAKEFAESVKSQIRGAPEVISSGSPDWQVKDLAVSSVDVVDAGKIFKRKKKYQGTDIPVSLVSSSPGGGKGGWASLVEEFGFGGKPGNFSWLKTVFKFGGIAGNKRYTK